MHSSYKEFLYSLSLISFTAPITASDTPFIQVLQSHFKFTAEELYIIYSYCESPIQFIKNRWTEVETTYLGEPAET